MKLLKKILISVMILLVTLFISLLVVANFYEDKVKALAIQVLEKNLDCDIYIENIERDVRLDVYRNFPKASLGFHHIYTFGKSEGKQDTLLSLEKIDVLFNVMNLFEDDITINEIHFENGSLFIKEDGKNSNYHVWRSDTASTKMVDFEVEEFIVKGVDFKYYDVATKKQTSTYVEDAEFTLEVLEKSTKIKSSGKFSDVNLHAFNKDIRPLNLYVNSNLELDSTGIQIKESNVAINGMNVSVNGHWGEESGDLSYLVNDLNYQKLKWIYRFDKETQESIDQLSGKLKSKGRVKLKSGVISIENEFSSAGTNYQTDSLSLQDLSFQGRFKMPNLNKTNESRLDIKDLQGSYKGVPVSLNLSLSNSSWLVVKGSSKGDLSQLKEVLEDAEIAEMSGDYQMDFEYKSGLSYVSENVFNKLSVSGNISNASLRQNDSPYLLSNFSGEFNLKKGRINISDFKGMVNQSDVLLNGAIHNLFNDQMVSLKADLKSKHLRLEDFMIDDGKGSSEVYIPEQMQFKFTTHFDKMTYTSFEGTNVSGSLSYRGKQLFFFPLTMNTADGKMVLRGKLDARNDGRIDFKSNTTLENINLQKLFASLNNFGQTYVTDKHIRGIAKAEIETHIPFDTHMNPQIEKVYLLGEIEVNQGELIDNEIMLDLSDFIEISELKHIKFSKLKNSIKVENQRIYIPEMDISSNAMNVTLSGEQGFDEAIDYHFVVKLNEVLSKRAIKKKENSEFGEVENDQSSIRLFIKMTGTLDDPKIKYDRKNMMNTLKKDLLNEGKELKKVLKEEFGNLLQKEKERKDNDKLIQSKKKETSEQPTIEVDSDWGDDW